MWLFTPYGFVSAVQHFKDRTLMVLRFRTREHADLYASLVDELTPGGRGKIEETLHTDYRYRFTIDRTTWALLLVKLADDIDYTNFKGQCEEANGPGPYIRALHDVWGVMYKLQPYKPLLRRYTDDDYILDEWLREHGYNR